MAHPHVLPPSPLWKEPLSKQRRPCIPQNQVIPQNLGIPQNQVVPQNRGIPQDPVFRKIKLFRYYAFSVFRMYSAKSSWPFQVYCLQNDDIIEFDQFVS